MAPTEPPVGRGASYPEAARLGIVEDLHAQRVADPYRWLEDADDPDVEAWSAAQDVLVRGRLDALPGRPHLEQRLRQLLPGFAGAPVLAGERAFWLRRQPDQDHPVLLTASATAVREMGAKGHAGEAISGARVLLDPSARSPDHTTTLDGWVPSNEGERVAVFLSEGGAEEASLVVLDAATGATVDGPIVLGRSFALAWVPGGTDYVYVRRLPDELLPAGEGQFHRRVWRRHIGTPVDDDLLLFGDGRHRTTYYGLDVSRDGRWLCVSASLGTSPRNDVYLADLRSSAPEWRTVQEDVDAFTSASFGPDGRLYLMTNRDAPRGRLAFAEPEHPEEWADLVSESLAVLEAFVVTDDVVACVHTRDVVAELSCFDRVTGGPLGPLRLPGLGVADISVSAAGGTDVWVGYSDHVTPYRVLHADLGSPDLPDLTVWAAPPGAPVVDGIEVRQEWVTSSDGTRLPVFVIAAADSRPSRNEPRPTVLYGYGGFNVALVPSFSATVVAWVEAGGVWAVANLRGGSEYGETWHRDGMRAHKQRVFDDFAAAARWLISSGWTDAAHLGISGGSNGGLLVGAALTQHPELFGAVVCSAPLLDMVRYERFGLGVTWNDEYGTADVAEEFAWLYAYSPYHHVVAGRSYPSTLFTVFDRDTRVDPLHARKMCAALQWATSRPIDEAPILIRRERDVGHSARSVSRTIALGVDTISFLAARLGLAFNSP